MRDLNQVSISQNVEFFYQFVCVCVCVKYEERTEITSVRFEVFTAVKIRGLLERDAV
jgi:hypothetical protein